jgi:hypothetical protein
VWHVSTAPHGITLSRVVLEQQARRVLVGHGDPAAGEWTDFTGVAFHLRRRLTEAEAAKVGPVLDIRHTPEARRRLLALGSRSVLVPSEVIAREVGLQVGQ